MHEVENFFCQFPNPWTLRVSGMGGYTSKCEKSQNYCTLLCTNQMNMLINRLQHATEVEMLYNVWNPSCFYLTLCKSIIYTT
jgi:hypothetical protein